MSEKVLVTGCAGFIGYHTTLELLRLGYDVIGVDNVNDYYSIKLKYDRLAQLKSHANFAFHKVDIDNTLAFNSALAGQSCDYVIHLAAQAGVRYSIENPQAYGRSNLMGFLTVLEWVRNNPVKHFVYASSSSVYGNETSVPFGTDARAEEPVSLYAATKRANELMASSYSHLYDVPATGLRFFTVYGPYGRPDMAPMKFAKQIMERGQIDIYNHGKMCRDFTYIDDIVAGMTKLLGKPTSAERRHRVLNIGRGEPVNLMEFVELLEIAFGHTVKKRYLPMQDGDVERTWADVSELQAITGYAPQTDISTGITAFAQWYKNYYAHGQLA